MRLKIINKQGNLDATFIQNLSQTSGLQTFNSPQTPIFTLQPNELGYSIMGEAIFPYSFSEFSFSLDVISNNEALELEKIEQMEP